MDNLFEPWHISEHRLNFGRFAELTAAVFLNNNIKVYLYSKLCPTPFIPYGVLKYKCAVGVMVTASHNPKEDNGYKVYWGNGCQIIPPHDKGIQNSILENLQPEESSWDTSIVYKHTLFKDPLEEVMESYFSEIKKNVLYAHLAKNSPVKFVYTPTHGVGYNYMQRAFETTGFKVRFEITSIRCLTKVFQLIFFYLQPFIVVEEQKDPDPEFPTVKFPNPEEPCALKLSIETADKTGSRIILANDPDADRLACAIKTKELVV